MLLICGFLVSFFRSGFSGFSVLCPFCFSGFVFLFLVGGVFLCLVPLVPCVLLFVLVVVVSVSCGVVFVGLLPCFVCGFVLLLLIVVFLLVCFVSCGVCFGVCFGLLFSLVCFVDFFNFLYSHYHYHL